MKKRKITIAISTLMIGAMISLASMTYADSGIKDKACSITNPSPDEANIKCEGEGSLCSGYLDCVKFYATEL